MKVLSLALVAIFAMPCGAQNPPQSSCVIVKRMGPADQVTSHLYSFGLRGKQFQYIEGQFPKGIKFHGRMTDNDVRKIQEKGGRVLILEQRYVLAELEASRKSCQATPADSQSEKK